MWGVGGGGGGKWQSLGNTAKSGFPWVLQPSAGACTRRVGCFLVAHKREQIQNKKNKNKKKSCPRWDRWSEWLQQILKVIFSSYYGSGSRWWRHYCVAMGASVVVISVQPPPHPYTLTPSPPPMLTCSPSPPSSAPALYSLLMWAFLEAHGAIGLQSSGLSPAVPLGSRRS